MRSNERRSKPTTKEGVMSDKWDGLDVAREKAKTEEICKQRNLALEMYERQLETSTELGYRVTELEETNTLLLQALEAARIEHHECDGDPWFSCPLSEHGCADENKKGCTCGADKHNERIDKAIQTAKGERW